MRVTVLLAAVLVLAGCGGASPIDRTSGPSSGPSIRSPQAGLPPKTAVFTPAQLTNSEFEDDADWTPSARDVVAAERVVRARFEAVELAPGLRPFGAYHRQYAGLRGHAVAVNALCDTHGLDWRTRWITVADGGACYWQATVRDGRVLRFSVNGPG